MVQTANTKWLGFAIKWIVAGVVGIGVGVWDYMDPALQTGIGWRAIVAGCIMLSIGIASAITEMRIQPADQTLHLTLFTLGAIILAWIWSITMIDRQRLSFLKSYLLTDIVWCAVLAFASPSPSLAEWAVRWSGST